MLAEFMTSLSQSEILTQIPGLKYDTPVFASHGLGLVMSHHTQPKILYEHWELYLTHNLAINLINIHFPINVW